MRRWKPGTRGPTSAAAAHGEAFGGASCRHRPAAQSWQMQPSPPLRRASAAPAHQLRRAGDKRQAGILGQQGGWPACGDCNHVLIAQLACIGGHAAGRTGMFAGRAGRCAAEMQAQPRTGRGMPPAAAPALTLAGLEADRRLADARGACSCSRRCGAPGSSSRPGGRKRGNLMRRTARCLTPPLARQPLLGPAPSPTPIPAPPPPARTLQSGPPSAAAPRHSRQQSLAPPRRRAAPRCCPPSALQARRRSRGMRCHSPPRPPAAGELPSGQVHHAPVRGIQPGKDLHEQGAPTGGTVGVQSAACTCVHCGGSARRDAAAALRQACWARRNRQRTAGLFSTAAGWTRWATQTSCLAISPLTSGWTWVWSSRRCLGGGAAGGGEGLAGRDGQRLLRQPHAAASQHQPIGDPRAHRWRSRRQRGTRGLSAWCT